MRLLPPNTEKILEALKKDEAFVQRYDEVFSQINSVEIGDLRYSSYCECLSNVAFMRYLLNGDSSSLAAELSRALPCYLKCFIGRSKAIPMGDEKKWDWFYHYSAIDSFCARTLCSGFALTGVERVIDFVNATHYGYFVPTVKITNIDANVVRLIRACCLGHEDGLKAELELHKNLPASQEPLERSFRVSKKRRQMVVEGFLEHDISLLREGLLQTEKWYADTIWKVYADTGMVSGPDGFNLYSSTMRRLAEEVFGERIELNEWYLLPRVK